MPEIAPRSTVSAVKNTPPPVDREEARLEANPTRTFPLSPQFFPEFFRELESAFVFPGVFYRLGLNNSAAFMLETNFKLYQRGGAMRSVELNSHDAAAILLLAENPSLYREPSDDGIQSIKDLKAKIADTSNGQGSPGTSHVSEQAG